MGIQMVNLVMHAILVIIIIQIILFRLGPLEQIANVLKLAIQLINAPVRFFHIIATD